MALDESALRRVLLVLALGACASPQPTPVMVAPPDQPTCDTEVVQWPRVLKEVKVSAPREAPAGRHDVKLSLSISADGRVSAVQVAAGAGAPFDDVAKAAIAEFVFNPGRDRDNHPVACKITYRYIFFTE
jgi:outer membrane biosynthesis protein TonB